MSERLTTQEAAKFLGVSISTLYRMEKKGLLVPIRTPGGQRRFCREQLEAYLRNSRDIRAPQNPSLYRIPERASSTVNQAPAILQASLFETSDYRSMPYLGVRLTGQVRRDLRREYDNGHNIVDWLEEWEFRGFNTKTYTHGFHTYPAMFIPQVARKLISTFSNEGDTIADIFCGSGTALVEAKLLGRHALGIELNPLAVLIAKVKTTPIDPDRLCDAYQRLLTAYASKPFAPVTFPPESNIDFWFSPQAIGELNALKQAIISLEEENVVNFFLVAFSEIIRKVSFTKHDEFKLVRDKGKLVNGTSTDILRAFCDVVNENILGMRDFWLDATDARTQIICGDSTKDQGIPENSVDLIVTSPPYGDSRTTVAYGQFSRLSAQWLDLLPNGKKDIDSELLGGKVAVDSQEPVLSYSNTLRQAVQLIAEQDERRAREVVGFYRDLYKALIQARRILKVQRYFVVVIGNRTVKGINLKTDIIISELCEGIGFTTHAVLYRNIPNKRMPMENSPTNIPGAKGKTMHKESIVIMKKR
jgi:excisionase family DNA binding protein